MAKAAGLLMAGAALAIAVPAQASDCWTGEAAAAARVRDLQSRLMVATMQCHAIGADIAPAYNAFIRTNRGRLESVNGAIKARFAAAFGAAAQTQYDRFTTSLANAYGADHVDPFVCEAMRGAAQEAEAIGGDPERLLALAERVGAVPPRLPGGLCRVTDVVLHVAATQLPDVPAPAVRMASLDVPAVRVFVGPAPAVRVEAATVAFPVVPPADGPRIETPVAAVSADPADDAAPAPARPTLTLARLLGDTRN